MSRASIIIELKIAILCGKVGQLEVHGPFDTREEAEDYCGKILPDRTIEYTVIQKEIVTHG